MKFKVEEPYRTALILSVTISVFAGAAYLLIPKKNKEQMYDFIKYRILKQSKIRKDERKMAETPNMG